MPHTRDRIIRTDPLQFQTLLVALANKVHDAKAI